VHVLFVHRNFPAQFGHIAARGVAERGWKATFVSEKPPGTVDGVDNIQYRPRGGASDKTHYLSRTFENGIWHAAAVYEALKPVSAAIRPDLIVGHSGWGSTVFLRQLYPDVPVINYFEYFYRPRDSDLDFRADVPVAEIDRLRSPARNAMILLDLEYCAAGYSPTAYQHGLMPDAYKPKLRVIHDGIDTSVWHRRELPERRIGNLVLSEGERLVTYVSRGLEMMRGFDVFMKAAKRICDARSDVRFVVVGSEEVSYGGDLRHTGGRSFRDFVLAQDDYDLDRIHFVGRVRPEQLARLLSLSDLHFYLTVPFVLSWSCLDAMACGATMLCSDTAPVREVITDEENGLLCDFFDDAALAERALEVLDDPAGHRERLGAAAERTVAERYALEVTFPEMAGFYEAVAAGERAGG
jgi:glycosyltransferase involved in cell wall biosynthesis